MYSSYNNVNKGTTKSQLLRSRSSSKQRMKQQAVVQRTNPISYDGMLLPLDPPMGQAQSRASTPSKNAVDSSEKTGGARNTSSARHRQQQRSSSRDNARENSSSNGTNIKGRLIKSHSLKAAMGRKISKHLSTTGQQQQEEAPIIVHRARNRAPPARGRSSHNILFPHTPFSTVK